MLWNAQKYEWSRQVGPTLTRVTSDGAQQCLQILLTGGAVDYVAADLQEAQKEQNMGRGSHCEERDIGRGSGSEGGGGSPRLERIPGVWTSCRGA